MRGPSMMPWSIARFRPNAGPPTSRTVVKPRISVSVASSPAARLAKPMSLIASAGRGRNQHRVPVRIDQAGHQYPAIARYDPRTGRFDLAGRDTLNLVSADEHV